MRVCTMLLVVYYHCICFYTPVWDVPGALQIPIYECMAFSLNAIHMPAFVYISGFCMLICIYTKGNTMMTVFSILTK